MMYKKIQENLKYCKKLIKDVNEKIVCSIKNEDEESEILYTNILILYTGMYYECRVSKLFYEKDNYLTNKEIKSVNNCEAKYRISYYFTMILSKKNNINLIKIINGEEFFLKLDELKIELKTRLADLENEEFDYILNIIETEIEPITNLRNRVAHGQVVNHFNSNLSQTSLVSMQHSIKIDKHVLKQKLNIIKYVCLILEYNMKSNLELNYLIALNKKNIEKSLIQMKNTNSYAKQRAAIIKKHQQKEGHILKNKKV